MREKNLLQLFLVLNVALAGAFVIYLLLSANHQPKVIATTFPSAPAKTNVAAITNVLLGFMMASVDNFAHIGGFIGGFLAGMALDPLKPERIDHMVIAVACIVLSVLSLVASAFVPIGL